MNPAPPTRPSAANPSPAAPASPPIRVLVVDDSAFMRKAISQMIASEPGLEVVDTAMNGQFAIDKCKSLRPDVVTLDLEMPVMDGITALPRILAECSPPPAVLMCSSLTRAGSHEALRSLELGAADVIAKDASHFSLTVSSMRDELVAKIKAIARGPFARRGPASASSARPARPAEFPSVDPASLDLVVIGSSTGGPPVLEALIRALPADLPVPVVIAQHMPAAFTLSLAQRLDTISACSVLHAENAMRLVPGAVYVAEGGKHLRILRSGVGKYALEVSPEPAAAFYKPSVNELFASAARTAGSRALAVILTGMGDDGCLGAKELHAKGATILAQDMESCVVYGMPKAVVQAGLAHASLAPAQIAEWLAKLVPPRKPTPKAA